MYGNPGFINRNATYGARPSQWNTAVYDTEGRFHNVPGGSGGIRRGELVTLHSHRSPGGIKTGAWIPGTYADLKAMQELDMQNDRRNYGGPPIFLSPEEMTLHFPLKTATGRLKTLPDFTYQVSFLDWYLDAKH
jgi:hypothetical protein